MDAKTEKENNERNDVILCFQALGLPFGATPEEIEKAYVKLGEKLKKELQAPDPSVRRKAAEDQELIADLYEKIRNSVTYKGKLKEMEKTTKSKNEERAKNAQLNLRLCPSCNRSIHIGFKVCPLCRKPILTPFQQTMQNLFNWKTMLALGVVLAIAAVAGYMYLMFR